MTLRSPRRACCRLMSWTTQAELAGAQAALAALGARVLPPLLLQALGAAVRARARARRLCPW